MNKRTLAIDLETYSNANIKETGVYRYVDDPNFQILLFAYAFDGEPVEIVDYTQNEYLPQIVVDALDDPEIVKTAFNANFEINALRRGRKLKTEHWECTMIKALTLGLPSSLDMVGKALKLPEDKQKLKIGKELINYFCKPCKPTAKNGGRTRNTPEHDMEKWELFKEYCKQDVETEREIRKKLSIFEVPKKEHDLWVLDQKINDRGVALDYTVAEKAIECNTTYKAELMEEAKELTGLSNPSSAPQLKKWISSKLGYEVTSLTKDSIPKLLEEVEDNDIKRALELRQLMAKTSIKKYETMLNAVCHDGRMRGLLQFYGANRTGRWAGRLVQVQNLPQNHLPDLEDARDFLKAGQFDVIDMLFDSVSDTLSQLIRTAFIPKEGNRFIVADFSAIEARVIAWLAGEKWRLEVFKNNGDIYCASASKMFNCNVVKHGENGHLRQKGKIAELALGYGGSVGAIKSMDKSESIPEEELKPLVYDWRRANPKITKLWWDVDKCAKQCVEDKTIVSLHHGIKFIYDRNIMFIQLPSGRKLSYINPKIETGSYGSDVITYEGMEQTTKTWTKLQTYGPKLVENIIQAIARDCLGETMFKVEDKGYSIVMHVHDELIMDVPKDFGSLEEVNSIFGTPIEWAPDLLLSADGYECKFYMKD